jgi:chemotaxis protein methyltransferase CheR
MLPKKPMSPVVDESEDINFIIALIYERSRIRLHEGKQALIRARLGKRMRHLGIDTLHGYCDLLRSPAGREEITSAVDSLTTNFTNFLREEEHFRYLVHHALPGLLVRGQKRFAVWSAACATGEEPYTLAMYLMEHFPPADGWDWQVLATDISTKALETAQQAIYASDRVANLSEEWRRKYFQVGHGEWQGYYRVKPVLSSRVRFQQINLLGGYEHKLIFEVIFCRNVMIYFDRETQEQLVNHLCRFLPPKGCLLIGHSESLNGLAVPLRCLRPSIYQKK